MFNTARERREYHMAMEGHDFTPAQRKYTTSFDDRVRKMIAELQDGIQEEERQKEARREAYAKAMVKYAEAEAITGVKRYRIGELVRLGTVHGKSHNQMVSLSSLEAWAGLQQEKKAA